jgi:hypothetical protein
VSDLKLCTDGQAPEVFLHQLKAGNLTYDLYSTEVTNMFNLTKNEALWLQMDKKFIALL